MEYRFLFLFVCICYVTEARQCYYACNCSERLFPSINKTLYTFDCSFVGFNVFDANATYREPAAFVLSGNGYGSFVEIAGLFGIQSLAYLDISHNKIDTLSNMKIPGNILEELNIQWNKLDYIPPNAFSSTPELRVLNMASNQIEVIHALGFSHLSFLKNLNLTANRLTQLNPMWFSSLGSLEILDMSKNNIHTLPDDIFHYLRKLKTLYLHGNDLHTVTRGTFTGLAGLNVLQLQNNHIRAFPTRAMQIFKNIQEIDMSSNHFRRLTPRTVFRINVTLLRLNRLDDLSLVDKNSITEMPYLETLELHHNRKLVYINPESFSRIPKLKHLLIHNNVLRSVEYRMIQSLPSLATVSFYGNTFDCTCSLSWVLDDHYIRSKLTVPQLENVICQTPPSLQGKLLYRVGENFPKTCAPKTLPLFEKSLHVVHGEGFSVDCRAYGVPAPAIRWKTPHGSLYANNSQRGHLRALESGTLVGIAAVEEDTGVYSCIASNSRGVSTRNTRVLVKRMRAGLIIVHILPDKVVVTWNGTSRYNSYEILCKIPKNNKSCATVKLAPYMRSYTISGLQPSTKYVLCIAMIHPGHAKHERCQNVVTKSRSFFTVGILNIRPYVLGIGVGGTVSLLVIALIVGAAYLRHKRRQRILKELYGDNLSQMFLSSMDSFSDITPMTYENLAAQVFDDDDIAEIRGSSAASASVTP